MDTREHDCEWTADDARSRNDATTNGHTWHPRTVDALLGTLSCRYRRAVLAHLRRQDGPVAISTLAERVASSITKSTGRSPTHETVGVRLHHATLPSLAAAGFLEYDRDRHVVEFDEPATPIDEVLSALLALDPHYHDRAGP